MTILHVPVTFSNVAEWVRRAAGAINQLIGALASYLPLTGGTLTGDLSVPDEAYGVGWNGSLEVPTKNALYDKIETISGGGVSDGDKGDIVVSSSGSVWEIDAGVVTTTELGGDITTAGKALLDDANNTAQRATLGLVIGTDVQAFDADLAALAANSTDGLWAHTGAGTGAARTLTAPAAGITITNPAGIAGNPTFALANDLSALEALSGTNTIYYRSAADTWTAVTIGAGLSFSAGTLNKATFRGALVKKAANQTGANYTSLTFVAWDSETYDTDSIHDNVTNNTRLTVPSGVTKVKLGCQFAFTNVTAGVIQVLEIWKNNSTAYDGFAEIRSDINNTGPRIQLWSPVLSVSAADYFEAKLQVTTDTSIDILAAESWFAMEIIE